MIQKCKFQKSNDPPICVISFLELTFLDHSFYTNRWINMVLCTCTMCYFYYPLDHFPGSRGSFCWAVWGGVYGVGDP